jgi:ABC-type glycerol-3-phosphate transport system substrate-binding protein
MEADTFNITQYSSQAMGSESAPVNNEITKIINGQKTIEEGLQDAADKIKELKEQQ